MVRLQAEDVDVAQRLCRLVGEHAGVGGHAEPLAAVGLEAVADRLGGVVRDAERHHREAPDALWLAAVQPAYVGGDRVESGRPARPGVA